MTNTGLYRLKREEIRKAANCLTECFQEDPLFLEIIPEEAMRKKVLPEFFVCYLDMAYDYCEMYADSPEINGIITVFDESKPTNGLLYMFDVWLCSLKFAVNAIRCDTSLATLFQFIRNLKFLSSSWENDLDQDKDKVHIDFFAILPKARGKGIATKMMSEILQYADKNHYITTVETHNHNNVDLYKHYGFKLFRTVSGTTRLQEYCMVRS